MGRDGQQGNGWHLPPAKKNGKESKARLISTEKYFRKNSLWRVGIDPPPILAKLAKQKADWCVSQKKFSSKVYGGSNNVRNEMPEMW